MWKGIFVITSEEQNLGGLSCFYQTRIVKAILTPVPHSICHFLYKSTICLYYAFFFLIFSISASHGANKICIRVFCVYSLLISWHWIGAWHLDPFLSIEYLCVSLHSIYVLSIYRVVYSFFFFSFFFCSKIF